MMKICGTSHTTTVAGPGLRGNDAPVSESVLPEKRHVQVVPHAAGQGGLVGGTPAQAEGPVPAGAQAQPRTLDSLRDWLGQPLRVNYYATGQSPLAGLVPLPRNRLTRARREEDLWLGKECQQPDGLHSFQKLLDERRRLEACEQEFCLKPLKTTLRNMQTFIGHIRSGQQFDGELTDREDQAMAWCDARTAALLDAGAPYKKTVHLTVAFLVLCDIITDRQVLGPLAAQRPEALRHGHLRFSGGWSSKMGLATDEAGKSLASGALDPVRVAALCWGGNNPGGPDEKVELAGQLANLAILKTLTEALADPRLLVYPSFQELDIDDFCRFGHLPLHPVGLTTDYATGADGSLKTPVEFAFHDLGHLSTLRRVGCPRTLRADTDPQELLYRCDKRLAWRVLLIDSLPACLAPLKLEPALTLLLFQLFHEFSPGSAADYLQDKGDKVFVWCQNLLAQARREERNGYTSRYQDVTDAEALMAACWTLRLWQVWRKAQYLAVPTARLEALARQFLAQDVPRLQAHLAFVAQQRPALRQVFADPAHACLTDRADRCRIAGSGDFAGRCHQTLFEFYAPFSGLCHIDYTDVAYFAALLSPVIYQKMAARFGKALPASDLALAMNLAGEGAPPVG